MYLMNCCSVLFHLLWHVGVSISMTTLSVSVTPEVVTTEDLK